MDIKLAKCNILQNRDYRNMIRGKYPKLALMGVIGSLFLIIIRYGRQPSSGGHPSDHLIVREIGDRSDTGRSHGNRNKVILVQTTEDSCEKWTAAFPGIPIIFVGVTDQAIEEDFNGALPCMYIRNVVEYVNSDKMAELKNREVMVVHDGHTATDCVYNLLQEVANPNQYKVVYADALEGVYQTRRHFGCGGTMGKKASASYKICQNVDRPGPIINIAADARMCSKVYPSMLLAQGHYALEQLQCAWIPPSSFWMTPFLARSPGKARVALSMAMERLLWYTGSIVQITAPSLFDSAYGQNTAMTANTMSRVHKLLTNVTCDYSTFQQCFDKLSIKMRDEGYLDKTDLREVHKWLHTLEQSNVHLPTTKVFPGLECTSQAAYSRSSSYDQMSIAGVNVYHRQTIIQKIICADMHKTTIFQQPWMEFRDILFIVTFAKPDDLAKIPYFETLYRPFFPHILYCGPGDKKIIDETSNYAFTYLNNTPTDSKNRPGSLHYQCLIQASTLGYNVRGYLQSSVDSFLNMHRLRHYDTDKAWYYQLNNLVRVHTFRNVACVNTDCKEDNLNNKFWQTFRQETSSAILELNGLRTPAAMRCNENRDNLFGGISWHTRVISDTSYIPARYVNDVVSILKVFLRHKVQVEIAMPTTLHCIVPQDQFDHIYMDIHNLQSPNDEPYSHMISKPTSPDLVILSTFDRAGLFKYDPRLFPFMYITPRLLNGVAVFRGHDLSSVKRNVAGHRQLFCDLIQFFGDSEGDASKYMTLYTPMQVADLAMSKILPAVITKSYPFL